MFPEYVNSSIASSYCIQSYLSQLQLRYYLVISSNFVTFRRAHAARLGYYVVTELPLRE